MPPAPRPAPVPRPVGEAAALLGLELARDAGPAADVELTGITHDSRAVRRGDLYVALPGFVTHGARFAAAAAAAGAVAILTDVTGQDEAAATGLPVLVCADPRARLGELAAWAYGRPGEDLLLLGVTGTNGKTTVCHLLAAGLRRAGHVVGVIGTVGTLIGDERLPAERTTPEATDLHALLAVMRERGVTAVAMEVSSHALVLGRVDGLLFDVAAFTNLSQDHLDFHPSMTDYFEAKASLFTPPRARRGVVCVEDEWGARLAAATASAIPIQTYASVLGIGADWTAADVRPLPSGGSAFVAVGPLGLRVEQGVGLPGTFNVANALGALATLAAAGISPEAAAAGIAAAPAVPGRLEPVTGPSGSPLAFVDYAHTPDAVDRVLRVARGLTPGRVLAVLGCGGDRDRDKRAVMGALAAEGADVVVVTDDNPRSEDPALIRATMLAGARSVPMQVRADVREVADRRLAISEAVRLAGPRDVVLVLGKGHEQGQDVAGVVHPFDDRVVLGEVLREVRG